MESLEQQELSQTLRQKRWDFLWLMALTGSQKAELELVDKKKKILKFSFELIRMDRIRNQHIRDSDKADYSNP